MRIWNNSSISIFSRVFHSHARALSSTRDLARHIDRTSPNRIDVEWKRRICISADDIPSSIIHRCEGHATNKDDSLDSYAFKRERRVTRTPSENDKADFERKWCTESRMRIRSCQDSQTHFTLFSVQNVNRLFFAGQSLRGIYTQPEQKTARL